MAYTFKTISAKPTFGTLQSNIYQSDYINNKKTTICKKNKKIITSQINRENLKSVCIVSPLLPYIAPTPCCQEVPCTPCQNNNFVIIDPQNATTTFYSEYYIDPLGQLF
jgi:DNA-binding beta-propeller fold protein YncE